LSKFEIAFEAIRKNNNDYKEILKKYIFRMPKRESCTSAQVGLIFISNSKEEQE
jgi:hypothetical protein